MTMQRPTVHDLTGDHPIAQLARNTWLTAKPPTKAQTAIVTQIWQAAEQDDAPYTLLLLEQLQALERYLWPCYDDGSSNSHVLLIALLINVKRREQLPTWSLFQEKPDEFSSFFRRVTSLSIDSSLSTSLRTDLIVFLIGAFQSIDSSLIRKECAPLVSINIWHSLHSEEFRNSLLDKSTQLQKAWKAAGKRYGNADEATQAQLRFERSWLSSLLLDFVDKLYVDTSATIQGQENLQYCERFLELLCDLESQLPTRRYVNTLLKDLNLFSAIRLSSLLSNGSDDSLLRDLFDRLSHYAAFPVDDQTGRQYSRQESEQIHDLHIARLQKVALKSQPDKLKILVLANYGSLSTKSEMQGHLEALNESEIIELCSGLGLRTTYPDKSHLVQDRAFWIDAIATSVEAHKSFIETIREMQILPTEVTLYDASVLRDDNYDGTRTLALPKLNLQYLSLGDFLWRSFVLHRSEAFYEIRRHVEDTISRMQPWQQGSVVSFNGFSRMAIPIAKPAIIEVVPARVGEQHPAEVKSEIILDVSRLQPGLRREWESLRPGDVVYLVSVSPQEDSRALTNGRKIVNPAEQASIKTLRCAEVMSVLDQNSHVLRKERENDTNGDGHGRPKQRRLLVRLDQRSYQADKDRADAGKKDVYDGINVVIRRAARENNFKRVLESLQQSILVDLPIPTWFTDVFLGYGDPFAASYKRLSNRLNSLDYRDTFLNWQHLIESLPGQTIEPDPSLNASFPPPYVLETSASTAMPSNPAKSNKKRRRDQPDGPESAAPAQSVRVTTYQPPNNGPYPVDAIKLNQVRFTPAQVAAITSGTQPGLTIIVGPPGTGKTDVATQIINNIYHNFPKQRTLLIAHSNQALNQLFQKIVALDIDERHLLRLGHGEEELETDASFSKTGRVESFLERGAYNLNEVNKLAATIGAPGAHGSSCETADYFDQVYVRPRWKNYWEAVSAGGDVVTSFPFHGYFADAPQPLFPSSHTQEQIVDVARSCERHMRKIFEELAEIRPFEILRAQRDKANYLLVKEARIIAMTSTHAAMRRSEIASLGFKYDNVIMEEAAQITEAESFIPLVMQKKTNGGNEHPLQRVILVGDHLQNSPVIQNAAFKTFANLDQSLFQRLIRLGVPHVFLEAQGRSRPSIAALYKWRYPQLTDLPDVLEQPEFIQANPGLRYDFQFIDVGDYKGKGESEPTPHFLQNLGEAEYAVALYQYMRLLGYPAHRISILCAYAGQRALIRDVLNHRCKTHRLFGMPGWVGTVDKYQGEQNDYIILSLVRTRSPGYLRDLRRLTVALSRARLGLYVLGRKEVFQSSLELREAFAGLFAREDRLQVVTGELFPSTATTAMTRRVEDEVDSTTMENVEHLGQYVFEMTKAKIEAVQNGRQSLEEIDPHQQVLRDQRQQNGIGHVEDEDVDEDALETGDIRDGADYEDDV